jgi:hypothetical protein
MVTLPLADPAVASTALAVAASMAVAARTGMGRQLQEQR